MVNYVIFTLDGKMSRTNICICPVGHQVRKFDNLQEHGHNSLYKDPNHVPFVALDSRE